MSKQFLKSILPLLAILVFQFISSQALAVCTSTNVGVNWSAAATWTGCIASPPGTSDDVVIPNPSNVTLNQDATVNSVTVSGSGILASSANFFLTLMATEPIINTSTLASRVKLSIDKDHTINGNINIFGLQWATSLTAPRTLTINGTIHIAGGGFDLDGTATNPVTLAGTGNFDSAVTVNNCAGKSVSMTNVTCNKPPQTITFNALPNKTFGDAPFPPGATASSGLSVDYTPAGNCTISWPGPKVILTGVGSCTITASQAGNASWSAATDVSRTFSIGSVSKTNQYLNFSPPANVTVGETVTLVAAASSGLPVTLTSTTPNVCTVTGTTLTAVSAGACNVTVDQAGDANYNAAYQVAESFTINAAGNAAGNVTVTPSTPPLPDYLGLFLQVDGTGHGKVTTDTGLSCQSSDCQVDIKSGDLKCNPQACTQREKTASYVTLTPQADSDSVFSSWGGNEDCVDGKVFMNGGKLCIAYFRRIYELTVTLQGSGQVTSLDNDQPPMIDCGSTCQAAFSSGMRLSLQATPAAGMTFGGWGGDCEGTQNPLPVTVTKDLACQARFLSEVVPAVSTTVPEVPTTPPTTTPETVVPTVPAEASTPVVPSVPAEASTPVVSTPVVTTPPAEVSTPVVPSIPAEASTPVASTPVVSTPVVTTTPAEASTPVASTPVVSTPVVTTTPAEASTPVASTPVVSTPVVTTTPAEASTPVASTPVVSTPVVTTTPAEASTPVASTPVVSTPVVTTTPAEASTPVASTPVVVTQLPSLVSTACALTGNISGVCNYGGQEVTNLNVQGMGIVSNGVVSTTVINTGWVSNFHITTTGKLSGGVVTGYIKNEGIMLDFDFKGMSILGGTLGGVITNTSKVGGYFQDVTLLAGTKITGGGLKGTIKGDKKSPALLENVRVKKGSKLSGVKLGKNVKLEKGVLLEK